MKILWFIVMFGYLAFMVLLLISLVSRVNEYIKEKWGGKNEEVKNEKSNSVD